jgi:hypothetical protein
MSCATAWLSEQSTKMVDNLLEKDDADREL